MSSSFAVTGQFSGQPAISLVLSTLAIVSAAVFAALALPMLAELLSSQYRRMLRKQRAIEGQASPTRLSLWRDLLRNGFPAFRLPAELLLKLRPWREACEQIYRNLDIQSFTSTSQQLSELLLLGSLISGGAAWFLFTDAFIAGGMLLLVPFIIGTQAKSKARKRQQQMREQLPDALQCLGFCFLAGCTIAQAIEQTAQETANPLRSELVRTSDDIQSGLAIREALAALEQRNQLAELSFLAVALEIQHHTGGSLKDLLESAAESVRTAVSLKKQLQVQTAQARLSFKVVAFMPLALCMVLSLAMEGYLASFFSSAQGLAILLSAIGMELAGIIMIRRILGLDLG